MRCSSMYDESPNLDEQHMAPLGPTDKRLDSTYFPVSMGKFALLAFFTFHIYAIYWFYRNWRYVRDRDASKIWPFWRAVFSVFWCYPLIRDIRAKHETRGERLIAAGGLLAVTYFLMLGFQRMPDPLWLAAMLAFLPLLPIVSTINRANGPSIEYRQNSKIRLRHAVVVLITAPLITLAIAPALNFAPNSEVVDGSRVPGWHVDWMVEQGMLSEDEEILFFYGSGLISFRVDGSVIADQSVVTYWQDEGETYMDYAFYEDIASIDVSYSKSAFGDTTVLVTEQDGTQLVLLASPYERKDREFVAALEARIGQGAAP